MFTLNLMLLGAIAQAEGATTIFGPLTASAEATAYVLRVQPDGESPNGLPHGAFRIAQSLDPAEVTPFAINFGSRTDGGVGPLLPQETIAELLLMRLSPQAAEAGIRFADAPGMTTVVGAEDRQAIQFWVVSDDPESSRFDALGVSCGITARVKTSMGRTIERTALLRVRQL